MNTITTSASTNVIVAVDLGKYKSVACVYEPATGMQEIGQRSVA
jgi:hypothetical protein